MDAQLNVSMEKLIFFCAIKKTHQIRLLKHCTLLKKLKLHFLFSTKIFQKSYQFFRVKTKEFFGD